VPNRIARVAGLEHQDSRVGVLSEARSEYEAGGAATGDDKVVFIIDDAVVRNIRVVCPGCEMPTGRSGSSDARVPVAALPGEHCAGTQRKEEEGREHAE
jgi:hypothetical protein